MLDPLADLPGSVKKLVPPVPPPPPIGWAKMPTDPRPVTVIGAPVLVMATVLPELEAAPLPPTDTVSDCESLFAFVVSNEPVAPPCPPPPPIDWA